MAVSRDGGGGGSVSWLMLLGGMLLLMLKYHVGIFTLKRRCARTLVCAVALLCANASAQGDATGLDDAPTVELKDYWYVGAGFGVSYLSPEENTTAWEIKSNHYQTLGLHVGYHFLADWTAELSYVDLGDVHVRSKNPAIGSEKLSYKVSSLTLGYDIYTAADNRWRFYLKGGVSNVMVKSSGPGLEVIEDSAHQMMLGAGGLYNINKHWFTRIEFTSYSEDVQYFGLSLSRRL